MSLLSFLRGKPAEKIDHQAEAVSLRAYAEAAVEDAKLALKDANAHLETVRAKSIEKIAVAKRVVERAQGDHDLATAVQDENAVLHDHLAAGV